MTYIIKFHGKDSKKMVTSTSKLRFLRYLLQKKYNLKEKSSVVTKKQQITITIKSFMEKMNKKLKIQT